MEPTTDTKEAHTLAASTNPHVLWRQVAGFVIWTGLLSYLGGGVVGAALSLMLGGVTFADAWRSGIYKDPEKKSFLNISPMAWGIVMALFFIVAYPVYLLNRNKLRTIQAGNGFFIATIVLGAVVIVFTIVSILAMSGGAVA